MDKKEKILKKLHITDYTNRLEKVLEKKKFSFDTKNLLLSMFYKIENGYQDYQKTKVQVENKEDFLEKLLKIIEQKCEEIITTKDVLVNEKKQKVDFIVDKENGKIVALGNEFVLLNAILVLGEKEICFPEEENLLQIPFTTFFNLGMRMHETEVIRDFNGWSWDIVTKDITNIPVNLIFQSLLYLLGQEFILQWMENESKLADYFMLAADYMKQNFGEERSKKIVSLLCKLVIEIVAEQDETQATLWKKLKKDNNVELEKLSNKQKFLEEITKEKKEITKKIDKVDKIMNNKILLQQEYEERNEKLPNKEKIFSIRHLTNRLVEERQELVEKMKQSNNLIDPKEYVARKEKVEKRVEFLNSLDLENKTDRREALLQLCILFLECFEIKNIKAQKKEEVIHYFYQLRYYRFLPFEEEVKLKEMEKLNHIFEKEISLLIEKAEKMAIIDEVTTDKEINQKIIGNLFNSKLIDLNHLIIETKVEDGKLYVEYYDTNILENIVEVQSNRTVKLKKKTKLFL